MKLTTLSLRSSSLSEMMRSAKCFSLVAAFVTLAGGHAGADTLFSEDFSSGTLSNWTQSVGGTWVNTASIRMDSRYNTPATLTVSTITANFETSQTGTPIELSFRAYGLDVTTNSLLGFTLSNGGTGYTAEGTIDPAHFGGVAGFYDPSSVTLGTTGQAFAPGGTWNYVKMSFTPGIGTTVSLATNESDSLAYDDAALSYATVLSFSDSLNVSEIDTVSFHSNGNNWAVANVLITGTSSIPEPASSALLLGGLVGLMLVRRRK